jgi:hypothetical protein
VENVKSVAPADPAEFEKGKAHFRLVDVDVEKATGVLVSGYSGGETGVVINLLTGELSRLPETGEQREFFVEISRYTSASPTGAAVLEYGVGSSKVAIKDAEGKNLAHCHRSACRVFLVSHGLRMENGSSLLPAAKRPDHQKRDYMYTL